MSSAINKKTLGHLAELARIELNPREENKLLDDLQKIVDYFDELQKLDTKGVEPMAGGTDLKNVLREDDERKNTNARAGKEDFPETQDDFLKVPPVF